jgi:preprotein translocase subunit SecB
MMGHFFTINAPAIISHILGYISMLTSLSGCGTVMLPTLNLTDLGEELASNIKEIQ